MVSSSVLLNVLEICQYHFDLLVKVISRLINVLIWVGLKAKIFLMRYYRILHLPGLGSVKQNSSFKISVISIREKVGILGYG